MIKAYKYRLNPNKEQKIFFEKSFGCVRYVYNWGLNLRNEAYNRNEELLGYYELCKLLTELKQKEDFKWLNDVSNQSLQRSIKNMVSSFTEFFRNKKGFPKFKSKRGVQSFQYNLHVCVDFETSKVKLPKIGWVKFCKNQQFVGKIKTVTISKSASGKYYISIAVDDGLDLPMKAPVNHDTSVGVDVGIKDFAVLSNGQVFENPKHLEKAEKRLKVLQRIYSKKQKGSKRQERARLAVAKAHEKVRNCRIDYIHKVTSKIIRESQTVIIEDLNIEGMMKNHNLAKHIASASWYEFFRQLKYKAEWNGVNIVRIGRFEPSSKMCLCGTINKDLKLSQREWICPNCGNVNDRDLLASINIKKLGLKKYNIKIPPMGRGEVYDELFVNTNAIKRKYIKIF